MATRTIKSILDVEGQKLTLSVEGKGDLIVSLYELLEPIKIHAALHGLQQKISNAASLPAGSSDTDKWNAMVDVHERILGKGGQEPSWNKVGEGTSAPSGLLFKALCRYKPNTSPETLRAWLDKKDKKEQAAMRTKGPLVAIIEQIKLESVKTTGIDANDLLDELNDI